MQRSFQPALLLGLLGLALPTNLLPHEPFSVHARLVSSTTLGLKAEIENGSATASDNNASQDKPEPKNLNWDTGAPNPPVLRRSKRFKKEKKDNGREKTPTTHRQNSMSRGSSRRASKMFCFCRRGSQVQEIDEREQRVARPYGHQTMIGLGINPNNVAAHKNNQVQPAAGTGA